MVLTFNKKLTRTLLKYSRKLPHQNAHHIEWEMEQNKKIFGVLADSLKGRTTYLIGHSGQDYRLLATTPKGVVHSFVIENLENFLDFVGVDEVICDIADQQKVWRSLCDVAKLKPTGILTVQEDKLFLYDWGPGY